MLCLPAIGNPTPPGGTKAQHRCTCVSPVPEQTLTLSFDHHPQPQIHPFTLFDPMADVHKPKSYDRVQASLVESDKNVRSSCSCPDGHQGRRSPKSTFQTPGCLHTLNYRRIYKRNAQQERLFMLQQRGVAAGGPGGGARATIPTPVADDAKRSTAAASLPIQDIGAPATEPTAYPNPSPHHRNTLAPSAIRHTRELDVTTVIQVSPCTVPWSCP